MDGGLQVYQSLALFVIENQLFFTGRSYGYHNDESSEDNYYIHASTELWSNNQWQEDVRLPVMMSSHCMNMGQPVTHPANRRIKL